jgi:large subunit ribosomal protein L10
MNREQKAVVIDEIAANIQDSQAIFAVDFRGITVPQAAELRDKLRDVDASFRVVKNSLTERAADRAGVAPLKELLAGPTALTFVRGDAATAAKAIADYARATQKLAFKGGVMDGLALTGDQVSAISRLLSRQALYGQLVGLVASPLTGLVRTLNALVGGLAIQLGAILEKKQSGEIPAGDPPAAAAAPAPDDAPAETPSAPPTPQDSGDEVAGAPAGQTDAAQAEQVPAADAPAIDEPTSDKEND